MASGVKWETREAAKTKQEGEIAVGAVTVVYGQWPWIGREMLQCRAQMHKVSGKQVCSAGFVVQQGPLIIASILDPYE